MKLQVPPGTSALLQEFNSPDGQTPFNHRRHIFLHVPPKRLALVPIYEPVMKWLKLNFGDAPAAAVEKSVREMDQSRRVLASLSVTHTFDTKNVALPQTDEDDDDDDDDENEDGDDDDDDANTTACPPAITIGMFQAAQNTHTASLNEQMEQSYLPSVRRYLMALTSLMTKNTNNSSGSGSGSDIKGLTKLPDLRFQWHYWLGDNVTTSWTTDSLRVELCCTLFNLAAMYSLQACVLPQRMAAASLIQAGSYRDSVEALAHRERNFRASAFVFYQLSKRLEEYNFTVEELDSRVACFFRDVMLAQAQECVYYGHKPIHSEELPPSPDCHEMLSKLAHCATSFYHQSMRSFTQYRDHQLRAKKTCNLPEDWYWHLDSCFYTMRLILNLHYAEHLTAREDMGTKLGFIRKCLRIAEQHTNNVPKEPEFFDPVNREHLWMAQLESGFSELNNKLYNMAVPAPATIESIHLEGIDKVSFPPDLQPKDETLRCVVQFVDVFNVLISSGTCKAWMQYRMQRAERYNKHLARQSDRFQKMMEHWKTHSFKLLLAYVHQQIVSVQTSEPALGFYETSIGKQVLPLRSKQGDPSELRQVAAILRNTTMIEMLSHHNHLETLLERNNRNLNELVKLHSQILHEETGVVKALCERMKRYEIESHAFLRLLADLQSERDIVVKLFGRYAPLLFPQAVDPRAPTAVYQNVLPSPALREHSIKNIREASGVAFVLLGQEFEYEKLEDKLAYKLAEDMRRPQTELSAEQLIDTTTWMEKQLKWMTDICEEMHIIERDVEQAERRLQDVIISADQLYRFCAASTVARGDSAAVVTKKDYIMTDTMPEEMPDLASSVVALFIRNQTSREIEIASNTAKRAKEECCLLIDQLKKC